MTSKVHQDRFSGQEQEQDEQTAFASFPLPGQGKCQQNDRCFDEVIVKVQLSECRMMLTRRSRKPDLKPVIQTVDQPINGKDPPGGDLADIS